MNQITARNVHDMLPLALDRLTKLGVQRPSRNGTVIQLPGPTCLEYERPTERVMFWPERDANPFFHLVESMWMLSGKRDVGSLLPYVARIKQYSDDGVVFNAAYGYRWRQHFSVDQLPGIIERLRKNPDCRRQVLGMWDPHHDHVKQDTVDLPCNTQIYFARGQEGQLDMTVCNRSNDLIWGACGANAVHLSFLQEFIAQRIGCPVGRYYQFTNNLHAYLNTLEGVKGLSRRTGETSPYERGLVAPTSLCADTGGFDELEQKGLFYYCTVQPMERVYRLYKRGLLTEALACTDEVDGGGDWKLAAKEWLQRRIIKREREKDDGVHYE